MAKMITCSESTEESDIQESSNKLTELDEVTPIEEDFDPWEKDKVRLDALKAEIELIERRRWSEKYTKLNEARRCASLARLIYTLSLEQLIKATDDFDTKYDESGNDNAREKYWDRVYEALEAEKNYSSEMDFVFYRQINEELASLRYARETYQALRKEIDEKNKEDGKERMDPRLCKYFQRQPNELEKAKLLSGKSDFIASFTRLYVEATKMFKDRIEGKSEKLPERNETTE